MSAASSSGYAPLQGKVALVTGGGTGIGLAIAQTLHDSGADVAVTYRTHGANIPTTFSSFALDVTEGPQAIEAVVDAVHSRLGRIDILVNNIGGLVAQ